MARISNEQIIEIRNSINIVDIISEYVPLIQKGKNYFGVCPFHDDHNPSMSVSLEKQIYTCFVCGATGNVFTFLMDYEHITFIEAVKKVADKLNISLDIDTPFKKSDSFTDKLYDIYDLSAKYYQNSLKTPSGEPAYNYLVSRKIDEEVIKEFGIGLSFKGDKLYKMLVSSKFDEKSITDSGLCTLGDKGYYDVFTNRIMFPIANEDGKIVGFSGRIFGGTDTSKYVNSRESAIFKKGHILYNYHRVKDITRKDGFVIIVEGFMDVIALYKVGIKNVIATMGTAITNDHAKLIKKLSSNVILMFDGDQAGNKATIACSEELLKIGIMSKIIRLENNLDPDEYIEQKGLDKLKEHIENPISLLDYKMSIYKEGKNFHNSEDISNYINEIVHELNLITDNIVREVTINKLNKETGVSVGTITSLLEREDKKINKVNIVVPLIKKESSINIAPDKYEVACKNLLFYMLRHKEVVRTFDESNVFIPIKEYRYLALEIVSYYNKFKDISIADFLAYLGDKEELIDTCKKIMNLSLPEGMITSSVFKEEIDDYIKALNVEYTADLENKQIKTQFKESTDDSEKGALGLKFTELKKGVDEK